MALNGDKVDALSSEGQAIQLANYVSVHGRKESPFGWATLCEPFFGSD